MADDGNDGRRSCNILRDYHLYEDDGRVIIGCMQWNTVKGLLHCFSICIEITGNKWHCFILKNVENCKQKFKRVKNL